MDDKYVNIHQDLINACRTGDRTAQFRIYKLYYKAMYNTSLRIVNDTAEAEDVMQEAFLEAFRHLSSYSGEGSFGSWLKRIVVNRSLDCLRKKKETVSIDQIGTDIADTGEPDREEDLQLQMAGVKRAIAMLPDDYRVVLTLFLIEGYDHEEIAQVLNISNQLSRTRYSRARQKLLGLLRQHKLTTVFSNN